MTIWQIIVWWLIGEVISWGLWCTITKKVTTKKLNNLRSRILFNQKIGSYPSTQNLVVELVRFVVFPYGIIQRTIVTHKMLKEAMSD